MHTLDKHSLLPSVKSRRRIAREQMRLYRTKHAAKRESALALCGLFFIAGVSSPRFGQQFLERASVTSMGGELPGHSGIQGASSLSLDGRFIAFDSEAELVPNGNGAVDIYVHDRASGMTIRASANDSGEAGDFDSLDPALSSDGKLVVFESKATNLVGGDLNGKPDVFLRNLQNNTTDLLSIRGDGVQGNDRSYHPTISADGSTAAFGSWATNLIVGGASPANIYVVDIESGKLELASFTELGQKGPGSASGPALSGDGSRLVFSSSKDGWSSRDANGKSDVYFVDLETDQIVLISIGHDGSPGNGGSFAPTISADGNVVAFASAASNLVLGDTNNAYDVFIWDSRLQQTTLVSVNTSGTQGNGLSWAPALSRNGQRVVFESLATNLGGGYSDSLNVFVRDLVEQETSRVSTNVLGDQYASGFFPSIDGTGQFISFTSIFNLFVRDFNNSIDVFVADMDLYPF
jgi:Tol biopolymer transport system component